MISGAGRQHGIPAFSVTSSSSPAFTSPATFSRTVTGSVSDQTAAVRDLAWGECVIVARTRRAFGNALLGRHSDDVAPLESSKWG